MLRAGMETLESQGANRVSLRSLAEAADVSKTAPYRHFSNKEAFLAALADEGYRMLYAALEGPANKGPGAANAMGKAYMEFATAHPELYRLMTSPISRNIPQEPVPWARKALLLLKKVLAERAAASGEGGSVDSVAAAWGYIHGLSLVRIDGIFPADMPEPDWDRLAFELPSF